jgi:hypothetical protein
MSGSHPDMRSSDPQHTRVPDENISQAIHNLHMPTRREGESQCEYDACIAASSRFNFEPENMTRTDQSRLCKDQPQVGAKSLLMASSDSTYNPRTHTTMTDTETSPDEDTDQSRDPRSSRHAGQDHCRSTRQHSSPRRGNPSNYSNSNS